MARDFLAIPATSVPSEQVFSLAGQILTKRRSSLSEGMMNSLMCTRSWLGFQELSKEDLLAEEGLLECLQDHSGDGDISIASEQLEDGDI